VSAILEGQGLNYALVLDETATRVDQLLVTGSSSARSGVTPARGHPLPSSPARRPPLLRPPPVQDDEDDEEPVDEPSDRPATDTPDTAGGKGQPQPAANPLNPAAPAATPTPPLVPFPPTPTYSSSPFNPKPIPLFPTAPQPQTPKPPASAEKAP
jgi:hypothetical protein